MDGIEIFNHQFSLFVSISSIFLFLIKSTRKEMTEIKLINKFLFFSIFFFLFQCIFINTGNEKEYWEVQNFIFLDKCHKQI